MPESRSCPKCGGRYTGSYSCCPACMRQEKLEKLEKYKIEMEDYRIAMLVWNNLSEEEHLNLNIKYNAKTKIKCFIIVSISLLLLLGTLINDSIRNNQPLVYIPCIIFIAFGVFSSIKWFAITKRVCRVIYHSFPMLIVICIIALCSANSINNTLILTVGIILSCIATLVFTSHREYYGAYSIAKPPKKPRSPISSSF